MVRIHNPNEVLLLIGRCMVRPLMESKFARCEHGFEYRWDRKVCVSSTLLSAKAAHRLKCETVQEWPPWRLN